MDHLRKAREELQRYRCDPADKLAVESTMVICFPEDLEEVLAIMELS